jgi:hypothetical protein
MWFFSSLLCLFLILGGVSASPVALFPLRGGAKPSNDLTKDGPLKLFTQTIKDARKHLAAAGVARCVSIFTMYPMDTVKVRYYLCLYTDGYHLPLACVCFLSWK